MSDMIYLDNTHITDYPLNIGFGGGALYGTGVLPNYSAASGYERLDSAMDESEGWLTYEAYVDMGVSFERVMPYQLREVKQEFENNFISEDRTLQQTVNTEIATEQSKSPLPANASPAATVDNSVAVVKGLIQKRTQALQVNLDALAKLPSKNYLSRSVQTIMNEIMAVIMEDDAKFKGLMDTELLGLALSYNVELHNHAIQLLEQRLAQLEAQQAQLQAQAQAAALQAANTFTASGAMGSGSSLVTFARGVTATTPGSTLALQAAVRAAIGSLLEAVVASAGSLIGGFALLLYPSRLGNSDRYSVNTPLSTLLPEHDHDLQAVANAGGSVDLPVRMGSRADDNRTELFVAATDGAAVPRQVRVRAASLDPSSNTYRFTTADTPPRTLVWTPAVTPGNSSTTLPGSTPPIPTYPGATITPITGQIESFPNVGEGSFDDYIIWFPASSGLAPIYVMFKDRRDEPGVASGTGQAVTGNWLVGASQPAGSAIPAQIADQLRGKDFRSFDALRIALWKAVGNTPTLANQFASQNQTRMKNGHAPISARSEHAGERRAFELHHVETIKDGGAVYDIDNLRVLTPKQHIATHSNKGEN